MDFSDVRALDGAVTNIVVTSKTGDQEWIAASTKKIGDWRSLMRTTYMRWMLSCHALERAAAECDSFSLDDRFPIRTLRVGPAGLEEAVIGEWTGGEAAANQRKTASLLPAYGVVDLIGAWEETTFGFYRVFLDAHPQILMKDNYKHLRKIYWDRNKDSEAATSWDEAWRERVDTWQRKKVYEGLGNVFRAYAAQASLKRPSSFKHTDVEDWAIAIEGVAELRNLVVHGAPQVTEKLASLTGRTASMGFDFVLGERLVVTTRHLQLVECFFNQLLTAINMSLVEKIWGPVSTLGVRPRR